MKHRIQRPVLPCLISTSWLTCLFTKYLFMSIVTACWGWQTCPGPSRMGETSTGWYCTGKQDFPVLISFWSTLSISPPTQRCRLWVLYAALTANVSSNIEHREWTEGSLSLYQPGQTATSLLSAFTWNHPSKTPHRDTHSQVLSVSVSSASDNRIFHNSKH